MRVAPDLRLPRKSSHARRERKVEQPRRGIIGHRGAIERDARATASTDFSVNDASGTCQPTFSAARDTAAAAEIPAVVGKAAATRPGASGPVVRASSPEAVKPPRINP